MTTRVAIVGGTGKLGTVIRGVVASMEGFEVGAVLRSGSDLDELEGADLIIDSSVPSVSEGVVRTAIAQRTNVLVATSGWSGASIAPLRPLVDAAGIGVVFIPNFSLGSVVGSALAALAASRFPAVEIIETHRETKVDSPSGTAVRTAELIAAARGPHEAAPFADQPARGEQISGVPVHSVRRPGVVARQETIFAGPGESLTIVHDTIDPAQAYAPGIRIAVQAARDARGVTVGLDGLIDLGVSTAGPHR